MSELQSKISANRIKLSTLGLALGVFAIASSSGIALLTKFEQVQKENHALVMNELAMRTGAVIHHELEEALFGPIALAGVIQKTGEEPNSEDFEAYTKTLLTEYTEVRNLQIAPDGVISQVYPYDERLIGHDHLSDPKHELEARAAMESRQPNLVGPLSWTETGESALVGHVPIFIDDKFWGFTISFIWMDEFLSGIELENLQASGYEYQLSHQSMESGEWQGFVQPDKADFQAEVEIPIAVPQSPDWILGLAAKNPAVSPRFSVISRGAIIVTSGILAYMLYRLLALPGVLHGLVKRRTADLAQLNESLSREVEERNRIQQDLKVANWALEECSAGVVITGLYNESTQARFPIQFVNRAFTQLTGYTAAEIVGHNCSVLQGQDTDQATIHIIRSALAQGIGCAVTLKNYRKDGSFFWNDLTISPIRNDAYELTGFIGFQVDVTDRLMAQTALQQQYQKTVLLKHITDKIRERLDRHTTTQIAASLLRDNLACDRCTIYQTDTDGNLVFVAEAKADDLASLQESDITNLDHALIQKLLTQENAVAIADIAQDSLTTESYSAWQGLNVRSLLAIRTSFQRHPNGLLVLQNCYEPKVWSEEEVELLESVAVQVGIALAQS
ncbi:MAG: PAS domain-containing protein, partial [Cyanobacteria bacterium P01_A01_bin.37]